MKQKRLSNILENCLDQIFNDQDTFDGPEGIDQILAQYPEYDDQLRPELEAAMWLHKQRRAVELRPGYLTASRQRLMDQIKGGEQKPVISKNPALAWTRSVFRLAFATVVLLVAIFGYHEGTRAVHASLPGDRLYKTKLAVEDMQLSLASDSAEEAAIRIDLADKRAGEVENLLEIGRYDDTELALKGYRENISVAADLIRNLTNDPNSKVILAQELGATASRHNERFSISIVTGGIPSNVVMAMSSTVAINDEITINMVVLMEEYDEIFFPLQASVMPMASLTSTSTPTPHPTYTPDQVLIEPSDPSETPEPSDPPESSEMPVPSDTPIPLDPADDRYVDEDDDELKKPKKPTKTPKDKDKDKNK